MLRIGIISFAHMHAYSYAQCLTALPGVELAAVWDDNAKRGRAAAKQFGAAFVPDLDTFLRSPLDGVVICSENARHREHVEAAAAAKKWILCEKPLAPTVADACAMVRFCKRQGVGLGTAFPCRFVPALYEARAALNAGEYGAIYAAACTNHGQFPGGWFADPDAAGGGATMDHTVHVADLLRWMLNREFVSVYAEIGNQCHREEIPVDDVGCLLLEMEGGVQVSHIASWSRPKSYPTWGDVTMEFVGEKGVLYIDAFNQKLKVYNDTAVRAEWAFWGSNADLGLVRDFVQAIEERRDPCASGVDGLRAVEVTVAAYASARRGRPVRLRLSDGTATSRR